MPGAIVLPLTIDGYPCQVEDDLTDGIAQSIISHQILGWSGPVLENMGTESRTISMKTLWEGDDYAGHAEWMQIYSNSFGPHEIVHPVYGLLFGEISRVSVVHGSSEIDSVHIDIEFIENGMPNFAEQAAASTLRMSVIKRADAIVKQSISTVEKKTSTYSFSLIGKIKSLIGKMQSAVRKGIVSVDNLVNDLVFPLTIPGDVVAQAFYLCASVQDSHDRLMSAPRSALTGFQNRITALRSLFEKDGDPVVVTAIQIASVFTSCSMTADALDEYSRRIKRATGTGDIPTRGDIEGLAVFMRTYAKPVIERDRGGTSSLAALVSELSDQTLSVISLLGDERTIMVSQESSIYVILLANRVHRGRAEAVCKRNGIENPNRVIGEIVIPREEF